MAWDKTKWTNKVLTPMGFELPSTLDKPKVTINYITSTTMEI